MNNKQSNVTNIGQYCPVKSYQCVYFQYVWHMLNVVSYMCISVPKQVQSRWKSTCLVSIGFQWTHKGKLT